MAPRARSLWRLVGRTASRLVGWTAPAALVVLVALAALAVSPAVMPAAASAAVATNVQRVFGANRIETAIAASRSEFPSTGSAKAVVLSRSDDFPDALAGVPLAAKVGAPLLLTLPGQLETDVAAEIQRVAPRGATVYVLGGASALSASVDAAITALGDAPKRLFGSDRFATAVAIADQMGDPTTVFEATGLSFPDALAAGPAAIQAGGAILLTDGSQQAAATAGYLAAHHVTVHYALGGPAAAADPSAQAFIGIDRYDTAAQIADQFFPKPRTIGVASGSNFPDGLAAGPVLAALGAPLLLVPPAGVLPDGPTAELMLDVATTHNAVVFGGTAAVSDDVANQVGVLAGASAAAAAASASATWTGRFGVRSDRVLQGVVTRAQTYVVDGNSGAVTTYVDGGSTTTSPSPTRAQLAALPLDAPSLEAAVNQLYAPFDSQLGITATGADELFLLNGEQVTLDPVASPSLRLAVYSALAGLGNTDVRSGVKDSTGRVGIEISAQTGSSSGTVSYVFDPAALLPLEDTTLNVTGVVTSRRTAVTMTTAATMPADPY